MRMYKIMLFSLMFILYFITSIYSNDSKLEPPARMSSETVSINSKNLALGRAMRYGNKTVTVILPPNYHSETKKYPVVYLLAGFGESAIEFMNEYGASGIYAAMSKKEIDECIMVVIDAKTVVACSFFANSAILGNWERFVAEDVVSKIDSSYRTIAKSQSRGIVGYAAGGTGAFNISMKYPDVFSSVYLYNAGIADDNGVYEYIFKNESEVILTQKEINNFKKLKIDEVIKTIRKFDVYSSMNIRLCYGLSFASNKKAPFIDFPYQDDGVTKIAKNESFSKKWESGFGGIDLKINEYSDNLLKLSGIMIEYGSGEENEFIINGSKFYHEKLQNAKINCSLHVNSGGHLSYSLMKERFRKGVFPYFNEKLIYKE